MRRGLFLTLICSTGLYARRRPPIAAAPIETDLSRDAINGWNVFARHAREFFETLEVDPAERERKKQQLRSDFEAVLPLL